MTRSFLLIIICALASCTYGNLPDKDLSMSNISYVELSFPKSINRQYPIRLENSQAIEFVRILDKRKLKYVEPENCYNLLIKLKNGSSVNYQTDGFKFQGLDDSSDLPFSFSVDENILTKAFGLKNIEHCR